MARWSDLLREQDHVVSQLARVAGAQHEPPGDAAAKGEEDAGSTPPTPPGLYADAVRAVALAGQAAAREGALDLGPLRPLAQQLVDDVGQSDQLLAYVLSGVPGSVGVATNCVNVAIVAGELAQGQLSRGEQVRLVLASLVHDMGMFTVPDPIIEKRTSLSQAEREVIWRHPERSAQLLAGSGEAAADLVDIVAQEHERCDGGGYPHRLAGSRIHPHAQLIAVADVLDALINPRPYHRQLSAHRAIYHLVTEEKHAFSPEALKALLDRISLYPLGTCVRLTSGEQGTVVRVNRQAPLRPVVQIRFNPRTSVAPPRTIDLSLWPMWHIVEVLSTTHPTAGDA